MFRNRMTTWKMARPPNYSTNINHIYPYSEVPYIGEYNLVRIPLSSTILIEHVDYWGEGKIETKAGASGFTNSYNVNHEYQLVSNGTDTDRKIPNRIPVISYNNCNTSSYIKDNSVKLVTLMGAPINKSCARDIARMVNVEAGTVVIFGFKEDQQDVKNLNDELKVKGMLHCQGYELTEKMQGLTLFGDNSHRAYTNVTQMNEELRKRVIAGAYDSAVNISLLLEETSNGAVIADAVRQLLERGIKNIMAFAFKIPNTASNIINNRFPVPFKLIFKSGSVKIMNRKNFKTIKLEGSVEQKDERFAWGDVNDKTSGAVRWEIYPIWDNDKVFFKFKNVEHNLFLKVADTPIENGDRKIWGSKDSTDPNYQWALEPLKVDDDLVFHIVNKKFNQWCKVDASPESYLCGSTPIDANLDEFKWFIAPWE